MNNFICKKCGSTEYEIKDKVTGTGIAHGLYCAKCGFWHKWLNKQELQEYKNNKKSDIKDFLNKIDVENTEKIAVVCFMKNNSVSCGYYNMTLKDIAEAKQQIEFDVIDTFLKQNKERYNN